MKKACWVNKSSFAQSLRQAGDEECVDMTNKTLKPGRKINVVTKGTKAG